MNCAAQAGTLGRRLPGPAERGLDTVPCHREVRARDGAYSKRDVPVTLCKAMIIWWCGSDFAKAARLARSSHTEKVQNVFRASCAFSV